MVKTRRSARLQAKAAEQEQAPEDIEGDEFSADSSEHRADPTQTKSMGSKKKKRRKTPQQKRSEWQSLVVALLHFKEDHGHFVVPTQFEIPTHWPEETHSLKLHKQMESFGALVQKGAIKDEEVLECLEFMEFPTANWRQYLWQKVTLAALKSYKQLHGDLLVKQTFVVPTGDNQWPKTTWTYALGRKVSELRQTKDKLTAQEVLELDELGFAWDVNEWKWRHRVLPALEHFKKLFGHVDVPARFVIDQDDAAWPEHLRGMPLGTIAMNIRHRLDFWLVPSAQERLEELGFDYDPLTTHWKGVVLPALENFQRLHGHCNVPVRFRVPKGESWPKAVWDMRLGSIVSKIRREGRFKNQIAADQTRWSKLGISVNPAESSGEKSS